MTILDTLMLRAAMALALACGTFLAPLPALAGPVYYVTVDTVTLAGQSGYLDFLFLGIDDAAEAGARVSQLSGGFEGSGDLLAGDASGSAPSGLVLGNGSAWNEAGLWAHFGGLFRIALEFELADRPATGTTLLAALLDAQMNYLGPQGDIVRFALQPGQPVGIYADPAFATVGSQPVPEPDSIALMAAGILLLAGHARRRRSLPFPVPPLFRNP